MDIYNDIKLMKDFIDRLTKGKNELGDINMQMISMLKHASEHLEGRQMDLAKEKTTETFKHLKNVIINLDSSIEYISSLVEILEQYLLCKFTEV